MKGEVLAQKMAFIESGMGGHSELHFFCLTAVGLNIPMYLPSVFNDTWAGGVWGAGRQRKT